MSGALSILLITLGAGKHQETMEIDGHWSSSVHGQSGNTSLCRLAKSALEGFEAT